MCHAPADCFGMVDRGYLDEGYFADIVLLDVDRDFSVGKQNTFYKCGWSPLVGQTLPGVIGGTGVNGNRVFGNGEIIGGPAGKRLKFRT